MNLFDRVYRLAMAVCGATAALTFAAMALLITFDVTLRNLGLGTLPWIVELSEYGMPAATFLAAPWLLAKAEHVRIDMIVKALPRGPARALEGLADGIGLAISLAMIYYGLAIILDSRRIGALIIKTLVFPEWWLFAPLPAAGALLALGFARRILAQTRRQPEGM
jgi:TRAP-type C4-dicarboxylate transport system permease small subunit